MKSTRATLVITKKGIPREVKSFFKSHDIAHVLLTKELKNVKKIIIICILFFLCFISVQAHPGIGIVKDSNGNIFYTDLTHVWKILPEGNRSIAVRNVHTHELYIDEQDNLYGEHEYYKGESIDKCGKYVWCLRLNGYFEIIIPEVEGFLGNNTLVRDKDGNSYWAKNFGDYQLIYCESPKGQNFTLSKHKFQDIRWMHYSKPDKNLYVIDKLRVLKVAQTGEVKLIANNLKDKLPPYDGVADRHYIFGITTDSNENVYLAAFGAKKVKK